MRKGRRAVPAGLRAVAAGEPEFTLEYPCDSPSEARWMKLRMIRLVVDGQNLLHVVHTDVSPRAGAAQPFARERRRTSFTGPCIDALPDFIFAKDREGRFIAANTATARIHGCRGGCRPDRPPRPRVLSAGDRGRVRGRRGEVLRAPRDDDRGAAARRLDGTPGWLCSLKAPLREKAGGSSAMSATAGTSPTRSAIARPWPMLASISSGRPRNCAP